MAKETKAQRLVRETAAQEAYRARQEATYFTRVMALLERAQKSNFELEVKDMSFVLFDRDERRPTTVTLSTEYNQDANEVLEELSWTVSFKESQTTESNRKFLVMQAALAKLTKEEKELLSLN
jgi:hypothetical protein